LKRYPETRTEGTTRSLTNILPEARAQGKPELSMCWVDPGVGLAWAGWVGWRFSVFFGLGWVDCAKSTFCRNYIKSTKISSAV